MFCYYNEHDPKAAAWLRELIKQGHLAPGEVDERSIEDVRPDELSKFTQCHFFAGIGVWAYSLRRAGWPDDRPVWTGSCPCQPFSTAGKGTGFADERHLWPAWHHLISQRRPPVIFGEQVASKDGLGWLDLVQSDMEATGYAFGAFDLCAAGVGAPHIRQRLFFVAHPDNAGSQGYGKPVEIDDTQGRDDQGRYSPKSSVAVRLANACSERRQQDAGSAFGHEEANGRERRHGFQQDSNHISTGDGQDNRPGPTNGFWKTADWLHCTDGKWRPVEPSTFPLAHGTPVRVGRLRGYGNAIVAPLAETFIKSYIETEHEFTQA